ncbi:MAG: M48 family metalloprotease [Pseudomonadales bacterium]|nr:M48 family metalloprotease [Pseudomonadales bacterium]
MNRLCFLLVPLLGLLQGCVVNPVTGRSELSLLSEQQELAIGNQQYGPSRQSQGGDYEVDPALSAYVSEVGQRLAAVSDRPLPYEFAVLNNSVPNAWALPGGKIAVNRGLLLELNNEAELAAVLGHEVVHAAARHGAQAMTRGVLLQGALVVGAVAARNSEFSDVIVGSSQLGAQLISQSYGRDAERESDYYGIQYMVRAGYDPRAAVSLQQTFVRLSEGQASGWLEGLFASHPPSQERVDNNQALVNELMPQLAGRDLELGEVRYQQAIAYLKESKPAYELYDEAERAIAEDRLEVAVDKLDQAIALVPGEARFSGLKADILLYQRRYQQALDTYDQAIAKDDTYYDYYLGRGVAQARLGSVNLARADLEKSAQLLPTAVAMNELGKLSLAGNDRAAAKQYFQQAASAQGSVGQEASLAFVRLDIQDNPATYVQAQVFTDANGKVLARVSNQSGIALANIVLDFTVNTAGRVVQQSRTLRSLAAGSYVDVNAGLSIEAGIDPAQLQMAVRVRGAAVQ